MSRGEGVQGGGADGEVICPVPLSSGALPLCLALLGSITTARFFICFV